MAAGILKDVGLDASRYLLEQIDNRYLMIPGDVSMKHVADKIGSSSQNVGMALDYYIAPTMKQHGYTVQRKQARLMMIHISRIDI